MEITKAGDGVMVALCIPRRTAVGIAMPGGEQLEDLHITLAYLGKALDARAVTRVQAVAAELAAEHGPVLATLPGWERFPASESSDGRDVIYLAVDSPTLVALRAQLMERLAAIGIESASKHTDYVPHVTLAYVPAGAPPPVARVAPVAIRFHGITVASGAYRAFYPFAATSPASAAGEAAPTETAPAEKATPDPSRVATFITATAKASALDDELPKHFVLGVVLEPGIVDSQGDTYTADEIRKSCWRYTIKYRQIDVNHSFTVDPRFTLLENYCVEEDCTIGGQAVTAGTWLAKVGYDDESMHAAIQSGEFNSYSIGGYAERTPVAPAATAE